MMHTATTDFSARQLRQQIEGLIPLDDIKLTENDNLLELGLDSMDLMRLVGQWRASGKNVTFTQLMEDPTLRAWNRLFF